MENLNEIWQTSVNGEIYEANFDELVQWIGEGSLLPQDKVRRGNLRWIEAQKVPMLIPFFNSAQSGQTNQVVASTNFQNPNQPAQAQNFSVSSNQPASQNFQEPPPPNFYQDLSPDDIVNFCCVHSDAKAKYHCETCRNYFCKACPNQTICPMCGATCVSVNSPMPVSVPQSVPQPIQNTEVFIDDDVRKGGNWIYGKAVLTMINAFLIMAGFQIQFVLGLILPEIVQGVLIVANGMDLTDGASQFHGVLFGIASVGAIIVSFIAYQAKHAKRWGFVLAIIIFSFDAALNLLAFSILGTIVHGFAIYQLCKGYSGCSSK